MFEESARRARSNNTGFLTLPRHTFGGLHGTIHWPTLPSRGGHDINFMRRGERSS